MLHSGTAALMPSGVRSDPGVRVSCWNERVGTKAEAQARDNCPETSWSPGREKVCLERRTMAKRLKVGQACQ